MFKPIKYILLISLIILPIFLYKSFFHEKDKPIMLLSDNNPSETKLEKIRVALIFDQLGDKLETFQQIYALRLPLTVAVIPGQKFSRNIAHMSAQAGFSVLIHLPEIPLESTFNSRKILTMLRYYLNYIRIAIGTLTFLPTETSMQRELSRVVLHELKIRQLLHIDGLISFQETEQLKNLFLALQNNAQETKTIITLNVNNIDFNQLKQLLEEFNDLIEFIKIKDYFYY